MSFPYTASYCEENIWHLAGDPRVRGTPRSVVLITNPGRSCAVWSQRNAPEPGLPVIWDYHVILIAGEQVFDLDTTLPLPCPFRPYIQGAFGPSAVGRVPEALLPVFRVIAADVYRRGFASDRAHMRTADGGWTAPPPKWPLIAGVGPERFTLAEALDLSRAQPGELLDLPGLFARFAPGAG